MGVCPFSCEPALYSYTQEQSKENNPECFVKNGQHLPQEWPLREAIRRESWVGDISLRDKVFDDLETLRRTAASLQITESPSSI